MSLARGQATRCLAQVLVCRETGKVPSTQINLGGYRVSQDLGVTFGLPTIRSEISAVLREALRVAKYPSVAKTADAEEAP